MSGKSIKTKEEGIEKNKPILKEDVNCFENCFASFSALDIDKEANKDVPKAIPIIPNGNWAILSEKYK